MPYHTATDMGSDTEIERLFTEVAEQHSRRGPDILISNAGYGKRIPNIVDIPIPEWDYTMQINLRASFILSKFAVPHMLSQNWGRIIFMSSIAAIGGGINGCHYAASKAGLDGMMSEECYAREAGIDSPFREFGRDHGLECVERRAIAQRDKAVPLLTTDRPYEAIDLDIRDLSSVSGLQESRNGP